MPTSAEALRQFSSLIPTAATPDVDVELQTLFSDLQRQRGLITSLHWEAAVENYITLRNMADLWCGLFVRYVYEKKLFSSLGFVKAAGNPSTWMPR